MLKNWSRVDQTILAVAAGLLLLFSYFLYDDRLLFSDSEGAKTVRIGQVYHLENDVRHKGLGSFSWYPASPQEELFQSDSIFTGENSRVSLQLEDGSLIHISENSLITLNQQQGQMQLDLKYGDLVGEVKENQKIQIRSGEEEFEFKGDSKDAASVIIKKDRQGPSEIQTLKGSPKVISKKAGSLLSVKEASPETKEKLLSKKTDDKQPPAEPLKISLITPDQQLVKKQSPESPFTLEWKIKGPAPKEYQVQIRGASKDSQFNIKKISQNPKLSLGVEVPEGSFQWSVRAQDASSGQFIDSESRKFHVLWLMSPVWNSPLQGETLSGDLPEQTLTWTSGVMESFEWELHPLETSQKTQSGQVKTPTVVIKDLPPGSYKARVRGLKIRDITTAWSQELLFSVSPKTPDKLSAPEFKQRRYILEPPPQARSLASLPATSLQWSRVPKVKSYLLEYSSQASFKKIKTLESKQESLNFSNYEDAVTYVRVYAIGDQNQRSPASKIAELRVQKKAPILKPVAPLLAESSDPKATAPLQKLDLSWTAVPLTQDYRLEISKDQKFSEPKISKHLDEKAPLEVSEPGTLYARVTPLGPGGETLTPPSNTIAISYKFEKKLATPEPQEPFNDTTLFLQRDLEPFVWLEWNPNPDAEKFEIQVSQDPKFSKVIFSETSANHRFLIKRKVPYGKLHWRVRAVSQNLDKNSNWSPVMNFNLIYKKNEAFVE